MIKIVLVEDEFVVREGIKKIDWAAHGYEFCGEAPDGEKALPLIRKAVPDIVITDIKMPFMDGLELTRQIRREFPYMEIIILSGYEEFSYAQEAISLGVSKYLTKPIGAQDLIRELDELKDSIEKKQRERESDIKYRNDMEEDIQKSRRDFFVGLINGDLSLSELFEKAEVLNIDLRASVYCLMLVTAHIESSDQGTDESLNREMGIRLHEWSMRHSGDFLVFDRDIDGHAVIFKSDDTDSMKKLIFDCGEEFKSIVGEFDGVRYYGGVGCIVDRLSEIGRSYDPAGSAFAHRYFDSANRIIYSWDEISGIVDQSSSDEPGIRSIDMKNADRQRLSEFLKTGNSGETDYFVVEFLNSIGGRKSLRSLLFRQYVAMDTYFTVADFITALGADKGEIETPDSAAETVMSAETVEAYCKRLISQALSVRDNISHNKYKDVVDKVIGYIEENYSDEDLTLNKLAEVVRFSPNHLSMIFSQQTGSTLSRYLIDYRISKAKEALRCTAMKSSEIAAEIGYRDPHYFSYVFKKATGMTPTQYRDGADRYQ